MTFFDILVTFEGSKLHLRGGGSWRLRLDIGQNFLLGEDVKGIGKIKKNLYQF